MARTMMGYGRIVKEETAIISMEDRRVLITLYTYERGIQRVKAQFADRNRTDVNKLNNQLREELIAAKQRIKELENGM